MVEDRNCRCYEECSRKEIFYILYSIKNSTERTSKIVVSLLSPPTERIQLTSRFSPLSFIGRFMFLMVGLKRPIDKPLQLQLLSLVCRD